MTVVSDTSPLNYLILINCEGLLSVLFRKIALPAAVLTELQSEGAPKEIHDWITHKPDWIGVHHVDMPETYLPELGLGERQAIYLSRSVGADALLMDDAKGRVAAERAKLRVFGTLGILDAAALRDLVDLPAAVEKLKQTTFRARPNLLDSLVKRHSS